MEKRRIKQVFKSQKEKFYMKRGCFSFAFILSLLLIIFIYSPTKASELKIKIIKIKDSGFSPFWSPDGKEIVYVDKGGLFVVPSDSSEKERKIINGRVRTPRWSPDGKYIAYIDRQGLKILSPSGLGQPKLIYPDNNVQRPVWSPDSKWIAFYLSELEGEEGSGVFVVNIKTLKSKQLSYRGINPFWSGDGKSVFYFIYTDKDQGLGRIVLADLNGTITKELTFIGGLCMDFTPKGNLLTFAPNRKDGTSVGVYLASLFKDNEPIKLSDDGYFPNFSFDGKWVAFFKYEPQFKKTKIYITPSTGGELIEIGHGIYPRWAFNKAALVYEMLGVRGGIYVAEISD
jgi:Tol biopolymer transport system component